MKYVICHYSEIGLKGKNRKFFEDKLVLEIKRVLKLLLYSSVKRIPGRILIELTEEGQLKNEKVRDALGFVFGLSSFSFAVDSSHNIEDIKEESLKLVKKENFESFRVTAKREDKHLPFTSQELNQEVGAHLFQQLKNKKVDLNNPDLICYIELVRKRSFIFTKKYKGARGLPMGTGGKAVVLLSGGIDSPVAAFTTMRRGVKVSFLHFHSYPITSKISISKIKELVELLSQYQGKSNLYLIPFTEAQKEVLLNTKSKFRVIFYRRLMLKIAKEVVKIDKAQAIITGESLGQVASQTIENMLVIGQACDGLIIRPLVCDDKESIIKIAKDIGTFDISNLPYDDCCSRFLPQYPETKARIEEVIEEEKKINIKKITVRAIKEMSCEQIYGLKLDR